MIKMKDSKGTKVSFRKWQKKGYSVFNSLKATIRIGVLAPAYTMLLMPMALFSQPDTVTISKNVDIDEVIIGARKRASIYSELTRAVMVVTKDELRAAPVNTLNDLLEHLAGVDVRQRGGHNVQADLSVRGGTFDQVLVLLNGINISDPQTGHHNLNVPIDLESIDRIEILRGPGSRVYGPGAFSGAINIVTTPSNSPSVATNLAMGQYGLIKTQTLGNIGNKNAKGLIAFSTAQSDGYTKNTDFENTNLFAHGQIKVHKSNITLQAGYQEKAFGAQAFYTPRFPEQFEETSTLLVSQALEIPYNKFTIHQKIYYRTHSDRFELFRNEAPAWYAGHNYHASEVWGASIDGSLHNSHGIVRMGVDFRSESIMSNRLGDLLTTPIIVPSTDSIYFTRGKSRQWVNTYFDLSLYFNPFALSAGAMLTIGPNNNEFFSFGSDASVLITEWLSGFGSINSTFRLPTFTDLYYTGPTNMGNPNLKPEYATTLEAGLKTREKAFFGNLSAFYRKGSNIIDWVRYPNETIWTTQNYTNLNTFGFEAISGWKSVNIKSFLQSLSLAHSYNHSSKESNNLLSYYVMDYLKHKTSLIANHLLFSKLQIGWSAVWQQRAGSYTEYPTNIEKKYEPFLTFNTTLKWHEKNFTVWIDAQNVGNTKYADIGNIPQPRRWISVGTKIFIN